MNKMIKVLWFSRHELTAEQLADLKDILTTVRGECEVVVETINHTWQATEDAAADLAANKAFVNSLDKDAMIAGVFPPVAITALKGRLLGSGIWSPVSAQSVAERADGTRQITFRHVRWEHLYI